MEAFRGSSSERIDPTKSPIDMFIDMMQAGSGDPQQLIGMLAGIVRQVAGMPGVPPLVKSSGINFAGDLEAWMSGKPPMAPAIDVPALPEPPASPTEPQAPSEPTSTDPPAPIAA